MNALGATLRHCSPILKHLLLNYAATIKYNMSIKQNWWELNTYTCMCIHECVLVSANPGYNIPNIFF